MMVLCKLFINKNLYSAQVKVATDLGVDDSCGLVLRPLSCRMPYIVHNKNGTRPSFFCVNVSKCSIKLCV
jgi:hypothetical protein